MNLLTESLWRDEAFSALLSAHNPLDIIRLTAGDATPPLHYLILHGWMLVFGGSEVSMRLMTVGFFLATAGVMYLIGRTFIKPTGLWLAALALTQPLLFQYAFEVRSYSQLVFLTALTIYFFLSKRPVGIFLAGAALLYTHLFGIWIIAILTLWSIYKRQLGWPLIAATILFLPWIPSYLNFARVSGGFLGAPNFQTLGQALVLLGAPLLVLILPVVKNLRSQKHFWLPLLLWIVPIAGTFAISQFKPLFLERYLLVVVPGELTLLGLAAREKYFPAAAGLALAVQLLICWHSFVNPVKAPFQAMASYIKTHQTSGDAVINGSSLTYFESQYYQLDGKVYAPKSDVPYYVGRVLIPDGDILTSLPTSRRYWLINLDEPGGTLQETPPGHLVASQDFGRLKLSLYETK